MVCRWKFDKNRDSFIESSGWCEGNCHSRVVDVTHMMGPSGTVKLCTTVWSCVSNT